MSVTRPLAIRGIGTYLPENSVVFDGSVRYRVTESHAQLSMLVTAAQRALEDANITAQDLDCVIGASAADIQPIPCNAALILEQLTTTGHAAAFDVNSTCTSFITALDIASRYIRDGEYSTILVVSGDVGSQFLNPNQHESYELFSDAAVAMVVTRSDNPERGIVASMQQTWPQFAHDTEIRGGTTRMPAHHFDRHETADYQFDMNGRSVLMSMLRVLPGFFERFYARAGITPADIDYVVPHQASRALPLAMRKLGIADGKYADYVQDYGNMVSASVPFALAQSLKDGNTTTGDLVLLCGTAAGLTANAMLIRL
ncbi:3-oxoacyl-ACP synthase [Jonesia quinghaiensis]|uniref:3-oxoacyl-ACP synthase n=1 Tax=Jonesia quinghaiensis TaxID=262806 RepID=UPI0004176658|nr:3-oxoacyl-ACP synthase [Jonesia quinghaiensis]